MSKNRTFLCIISAMILVCLLLVFQATKDSSAQVLLPSELERAAAKAPLTRIRVGGRVAPLPVQYQVEPVIELKFFMEDPGKPELGNVAVVYRGVKPDMFAAGRDVIVDGEFSGGVLTASKLLTQCPSKYEPPSPEKVYQMHKEQGVAQK